MLTAEGCRQRRQRLWARLDPAPDTDYLVLGDPLHLTYFANCWVDPISLGAGFPAFLFIRKDGQAKLLHENRAPQSVKLAHADEVRVIPWYDGQHPGNGPRQLALLSEVNPRRAGMRIHDRPGDPLAASLSRVIAELRRQKDADEIAVLSQSMRAGEAGHAWAREHVREGMTELDVYAGVCGACCAAAGMPVIVYGDFAVSPGPTRRGGPPTARVLQSGDMLILDFSVVVHGYRGDFTNTLVVGGKPTAAQRTLYDSCRAAMLAGENMLRAGTPCQDVYDATRQAFAERGQAEHFPHHAGHGLGLSHPEAPFIVRHSTETLLPGDVVTLEPGLYVPGVGGIRIEHNYLITDAGFKQLSQHVIAL